MPYSNRTSFMTAEQDSPSASRKVSLEHNPTTNYHPYENNFYLVSSSASQRKATLQKKATAPKAVFKNVDLSNESSISEDIESSHTILNGSSQTVYSLPGNEITESKSSNHSISSKAEVDPTRYVIASPSSTTTKTAAATDLLELKTYPIAWLLLLFIVFIRAAVAIFANTFSPIPSVTAEFMGITLSSINWLYNTMAICYIVASFFTSYLYKKIGIKWSVSLFRKGLLEPSVDGVGTNNLRISTIYDIYM